MPHNIRISNKRKNRRESMLENRKMDEIYRIALLDPQTCEGQTQIDPELLDDTITTQLLNKQPTVIGTQNKYNLYKYIKSFF